MVAKTGRPNAYKEKIEPRIGEIIEWARAGSTNAEIAEALGVAYSTFLKHVGENVEFSDSLKRARLSGVPEIKLALYRKAKGFEYEEKKSYIKEGEDGKINKYTEITKKYCPPDVGAIRLYLCNNTEDFRDKDKATYDFKEAELEIRRMLAEANNF